MPLRACALVLLLFLAAPGTARAAGDPPPGPHPIQVKVGVYLVDVNRISASDETFSVIGYMVSRWRDPRLDHREGEPFPTRRGPARELSPDEIWTPYLELVNAQAVEVQRRSARLYGDGTVELRSRFVAVLNAPFDFARFPFDRARLRLVVRSFEYGTTTLGLAGDPAFTGVDRDMVFDAEWEVGQLILQNSTLTFPGHEDDRPAVWFDLEVQRKAWFYVWSYFVPLTLIVAASWGAFLVIPPNPQITITATIGLIAYKFALANNLPRISYISFADAFFQFCLVSIFLAHLTSMRVARLGEAGRHEDARRLRARAFWAYPVSFLVVSMALAALFRLGL